MLKSIALCLQARAVKGSIPFRFLVVCAVFKVDFASLFKDNQLNSARTHWLTELDVKFVRKREARFRVRS